MSPLDRDGVLPPCDWGYQGTVYVICEDPTEEITRFEPAPLDQSYFIKIGFTSSYEATDRQKRLQTGNPRPLVVIRELEGTQKQELRLHNLLADYQQCGEWFLVPGQVVRAFQSLDTWYAEEVIDAITRMACLGVDV